MRSLATLLTLWCVLVVSASRGHAQNAALRVRVDVPRGVVQSRIEGQLADLEIVLSYADLPCESPLDTRIGRSSTDVDVLACVRVDQRSVTVEVIDVRARRAFIRRFQGGSSSARAEEAAVALRSTFEALRLGGELGIVLPPAEPPPVPPPPIEHEEPEEETIPGGPALHVALGATSTLDGLATGFSPSPFGRLSFVRNRIELGLGGAFGLQRRREFENATVLLTRHVATMSLGYAVVDAAHVRVLLSGGFGMAVRTRTTSREAPGFLDTPRSRTFEALAVSGIRVQIFPSARGALGFDFGTGIEVPFSRTQLVLQTGDTHTTLDTVWPVYPRFELGLILRTRP